MRLVKSSTSEYLVMAYRQRAARSWLLGVIVVILSKGGGPWAAPVAIKLLA